VSPAARTAAPSVVQERLRAVPAPPAVLSREREHQLTERQRELLEHLGELFVDGFAHLTMAEIASGLNCSLRTLYGLAPSRDELVLVVVDRSLRRVGRAAREAITTDMAPLGALVAYLGAANDAVDGLSAPFARDLAVMPAAQRLGDGHASYVTAVTKCLLELAIDDGSIAPVDAAAVAHVMAGVARDLAMSEVASTLGTAPTAAANEVVALLVAGLRSLGPT